ncbi:hypothetical protein WR164_12480 [Philodulcilactobacillus myokoensis]|uniref:Uncharacterized protein n=1 Tax=Philodulcilactobacillus myokoensis TaxID=2929573 RepID=A0A9W6B1K9_9LACO|nr:hypothetical protein [Philodulcilactobacillus myokoensis]GLB47269.1 hypothetical protein WR164_12480 [Philodulcilactobacillus myokoensis]
MTENNKYKKLIDSKNNLSSKYDDLNNHISNKSDIKNNPENNSENNSKVLETKTHGSFNKALRRDKQDIGLREDYRKTIKKNIKYQRKLRKRLANFFMWYMSIITCVIFYIIIDPFHHPSIYQVSLKETLLGVFFVNILSILIIMVRYSFQSSDKIMRQFNIIGRNSDYDEKN